MLFNIESDNMKPFPDETMVTMDKEMIKYHKNSNNLAMPYFGYGSGFSKSLKLKEKRLLQIAHTLLKGILKEE